MPRIAEGELAPDFTLTAADGSSVTLSQLRGSSVIVYFYPAAMTPGCTTQACDFRDSLDALHHQGYTVLGISPDDPAKLQTFIERDHITYPLLSDPSHAVLEAWGAWARRVCTARPWSE